MNKNNLLVILPIFAASWFLVTLVWGGIIYENYNHSSQFISELGATGAVTGPFVNYLGFIPTQMFILIFIVLCTKIIPKNKYNILGMSFLVLYTLSLTVAAVFPCDFECRPASPTLSHNIHIVSALPGYLGGAAAIFLISLGLDNWAPSKFFKNLGITLGMVLLLCFTNLDPNSQWVGLIQRILEASIFIWLILLGKHIKTYCDDLQKNEAVN
ncbi:DUF998 domain-containing protein [Pseudemcibacter aquimaris]|uniref:DUF998 domain-containing protein n=1 Tax=Pseudemcibacter aquimaris TaxID=2857064 RepID=UPI002011BD9E|nr:DUF998 domain-containing protein [Pseudemcibacter aquimaris]MCC3860552.1 DUF998 domain-containing protein [Pseudemcibacter aquimaris]WDU59375.1 DUF998 domain-containing protein [Pseudemcibacter aquimaris]